MNIRRILPLAVLLTFASPTLRGQLAITEVMSSASTNLGPQAVVQNSDFWELTNFGREIIDLTGYRWDDADNNLAAADPTPFNGLSIQPGESILFIQNTVNTNIASMINWWGTQALEGRKMGFYAGNGLSSAGDGIRLWGPNAQNVDDVVDRVDFGEALRGVSFTYDPQTGEFGKLSTNGIGGAFKAVGADDIGSPGKTTGPTPIRIVSQPQSQVVNPGDEARFTVSVQGRPTGKIQWHFKNNPIAGATGPQLRITNATEVASGPYHATIDNGVGKVSSQVAELVLSSQASAPSLSLVPEDLWMFNGQSFTFKARATGVPQPVLEWSKDGVRVTGVEGSDFLLSGASEGDSGVYTVTARNSIGTNSANFRITVTPRPNLVITEVMSNASTNVPGHADWWELSNLGNFPVSLKGYRFDDNSETLGSAFVFTNNFTIKPGESVVFVEGMSPQAFRDWWGIEYLSDELQIITYRGNGLSSAGDAVNVWNAAASEDSDKISSAVFSTATLGTSFGYASTSGAFGGLSTAGTEGTFTAVSGGDLGSPGWIRNVPRVIRPRFLEQVRTETGLRLKWTTQAGRAYLLKSKTSLAAGTEWTVHGRFDGTGSPLLLDTAVDPMVAGRFFVLELVQ